MQTLILETHQLHNKIKSMSMEEKMLEIAGKAYELTYSLKRIEMIEAATGKPLLAELLLFGRLKRGGDCILDVRNGKLIVR